jgi:hypothetical protein
MGTQTLDEYTNSISSPLFFNPRLNRGLSNFNIAQNLEVNYTWEIGTPQWASGINAWALREWEVGGVFEASTGVPFTPGFGGDALGVKSTDPNIDVPNLIAGPGCGSHVNPGNPRQLHQDAVLRGPEFYHTARERGPEHTHRTHRHSSASSGPDW